MNTTQNHNLNYSKENINMDLKEASMSMRSEKKKRTTRREVNQKLIQNPKSKQASMN